MPPPDPELDLLVSYVLRETAKQKIATPRIIRLRLYLYFDHLKHIRALWFRLSHAIHEAENRGLIARYPRVKKPLWYTTPQFLADPDARTTYIRKRRVLTRWDRAADAHGRWFEGLVRDALSQRGFYVGQASESNWTNWDRRGSFPIDIVALGQNTNLAVEVKNVFSDVYHHPKMAGTQARERPYRQIQRLFESARRNHFTPVLFAPLVHRSFFGYVMPYDGLFCQTFFQCLPPSYNQLCHDISRQFTIGHVKATATLLPHVVQWISRHLTP